MVKKLERRGDLVVADGALMIVWRDGSHPLMIATIGFNLSGEKLTRNGSDGGVSATLPSSEVTSAAATSSVLSGSHYDPTFLLFPLLRPLSTKLTEFLNSDPVN